MIEPKPLSKEEREWAMMNRNISRPGSIERRSWDQLLAAEQYWREQCEQRAAALNQAIREYNEGDCY